MRFFISLSDFYIALRQAKMLATRVKLLVVLTKMERAKVLAKKKKKISHKNEKSCFSKVLCCPKV